MRRYQVGQQNKIQENLDELTEQLQTVRTDNETLRNTVASLEQELTRSKDQSTQLDGERNSMQQENEKLTATIQDLQSQANDLARVNGNMRTKLESLFNSDETVKKLRAEHDSLEKEEQKLPVLERRKDIFLQLETLGKEYQLK